MHFHSLLSTRPRLCPTLYPPSLLLTTRRVYPLRIMACREPLSERFGSLNLPLGGKHGYAGIRKVRKGFFQGYTPKKTHTTKAFQSTHEAAVALAIMKADVTGGFDDASERKPRAKRSVSPGAPQHPTPRHAARPARDFLTSATAVLRRRQVP